MSPEVINSYFTPLHYVLYLGTLFVAMVVYYQWKWTKIVKTSMLILIKKASGRGDYQLVPQSGNSITLKNPKDNTSRMWVINELATIEVPYPGVGFIPLFLQKQIRMTIVDEEDWEPMLNRSPNHEMIASPAVLGNLMHEKITEAVITVNKEMLDSISGLVKKLNKLVNPTVVYIGLGLIIILLAYMIFKQSPEDISTMAQDIMQIKQSLGLK